MSDTHSKDRRGFFGAIGILAVVIVITVSLFFLEIPEKNNDVIKLIIGVLVGSLGPTIFSILGRDSNEMEKKNLRIQHLESENQSLGKRVDHLETMFIDLQNRIIDKLSHIRDSSNY